MRITRRFLTAAGLYGAALGLAVACGTDSPSRCFESGAATYRFHVPGDSAAWFRWVRPDYPIRVYAEPAGALEANTDAAIALWLGAFRCGELALARVADSSLADIVVRNPPAEPALPPKTVVVAADSTNACGGRTDIDTLPTAGDTIARPMRSYVWPVSIADSASIAACYRIVTAHELGHTLGLFLHSLDTLDLMHATPYRRALSLNDRYTVQVLYHSIPTMAAEPR